jgi:hypothetical protein
MDAACTMEGRILNISSPPFVTGLRGAREGAAWLLPRSFSARPTASMSPTLPSASSSIYLWL